MEAGLKQQCCVAPGHSFLQTVHNMAMVDVIASLLILKRLLPTSRSDVLPVSHAVCLSGQAGGSMSGGGAEVGGSRLVTDVMAGLNRSSACTEKAPGSFFGGGHVFNCSVLPCRRLWTSTLRGWRSRRQQGATAACQQLIWSGTSSSTRSGSSSMQRLLLPVMLLEDTKIPRTVLGCIAMLTVPLTGTVPDWQYRQVSGHCLMKIFEVLQRMFPMLLIKSVPLSLVS